MRRLVTGLGLIALLASACSGSTVTTAPSQAATAAPPASQGAASDAPATKAPLEAAALTVWLPFGGREFDVVKAVIDEWVAANPGMSAEVVSDVGDDKIIAGLRGGGSPDVAVSWESANVGQFCAQGGFQDLGPLLAQDGIDPANFTDATQYYTQYQGVRCALPLLADAYGLYYNSTLFAEAGLTAPPKTLTELADYAKKLTKKNADGTLDVVGFDPLFGFYQNSASRYGVMGRAAWVDASGKSSLSTDPGWAKVLQWQKDLVDWYGYDNLVKFGAGAGDEFSASNAFQAGKLAMNIDGEWRVAFIANEAKDLDYGTAPMPVDDANADDHGAGYINGTIVGIPGNAEHKEQAWALVRYLATDDTALAKLSNGLRNVPSTKSAATSPELIPDEHFATFLEIFAHPKSSTTPVTAVGSAYQDLVKDFVSKWQAGEVPDLAAGLKDLDQQIDAQLEQAGG